jgi:hypothetical protein
MVLVARNQQSWHKEQGKQEKSYFHKGSGFT